MASLIQDGRLDITLKGPSLHSLIQLQTEVFPALKIEIPF